MSDREAKLSELGRRANRPIGWGWGGCKRRMKYRCEFVLTRREYMRVAQPAVAARDWSDRRGAKSEGRREACGIDRRSDSGSVDEEAAVRCSAIPITLEKK